MSGELADVVQRTIKPRDRRLREAELQSHGVRTRAQQDRDRILYASAFRRLAGVTQVVGAVEGHIFHNRLTHSLEVAQLGRRIAERVAKLQRDLAQSLGGVNPDVVEAACLAHDLGHPPFGHAAEKVLDTLCKKHGAPDGFEGNAQSFRIVTRLSPHRADYEGLNLTRATLNAMLKYPWMRDVLNENSKKHKKFGAYALDDEAFIFARKGSANDERSVEAEIMDHADAIAYSVHDLDDFYRAGLIPIDYLRRSDEAFGAFLEKWALEGKVERGLIEKYRPGLERLISVLPTEQRFTGAYHERAALKTATSALITLFTNGVSLQERDEDGRALAVDEEIWVQMKFLQALVWHYVIKNPRLATQQHGQEAIITTLFEVYITAIKEPNVALLPALFRDALVDVLGDRQDETQPFAARCARLACDIVTSFGDEQALAMFHRLTGIKPGSVLEEIDR